VFRLDLFEELNLFVEIVGLLSERCKLGFQLGRFLVAAAQALNLVALLVEGEL
jgi:hypothetical protein